jgi:hypothetical protein
MVHHIIQKGRRLGKICVPCWNPLGSFGEFNVVLEDEEKEGGNIGNSSCPNYLKEIMFNLGVVDLGYTRNKFTWTDRRWGRDCIKERLDGALLV